MEGTQWPKVLVAIALLGIAGGYGYSRYAKLRPNEAITNRQTSEFDRGPDPERREQVQQQIAKAANLTPEQQKQLEEIREEANGDWRQMREKMGEVLTPEQREKLRQTFAARRAEREAQRDAEARAAMSGPDYERYKQRQEERRRQWRSRRGGGGGNERAPRASPA